MKVSYSVKGNFKNTTRFLKNVKNNRSYEILEKYGKEGVDALRNATPKYTGKTADSWDYVIEHEKGNYILSWVNSNVNNNVPIVILIQYGHATINGGWVQGYDFINPTMKDIFDRLTNELWGEIKNG